GIRAMKHIHHHLLLLQNCLEKGAFLAVVLAWGGLCSYVVLYLPQYPGMWEHFFSFVSDKITEKNLVFWHALLQLSSLQLPCLLVQLKAKLPISIFIFMVQTI
ncbi:hypothetical protein KI387_017415, partial [Taxus chinensis]